MFSVIFRYIIHKDDSSKFENLVQKIVGRKRKCRLYIRHKTFMVSPSVLDEHEIRFTRVCLFITFNLIRKNWKQMSVICECCCFKLGYPKTRTIYGYISKCIPRWIQFWSQYGRVHKFRNNCLAANI